MTKPQQQILDKIEVAHQAHLSIGMSFTRSMNFSMDDAWEIENTIKENEKLKGEIFSLDTQLRTLDDTLYTASDRFGFNKAKVKVISILNKTLKNFSEKTHPTPKKDDEVERMIIKKIDELNAMFVKYLGDGKE